MIRNLLSTFAFVAVLAIGTPAGAQGFSRFDYNEVTSRKKLPTPTKVGPLAAVAKYLATMAYLDPTKITIEVLLDREGRRVLRVELICKSVDECGDDSVAATREALDLRRSRNGGWAIVWVGAQFKCHKGRGHKDWSKALCT